MRNPSRHPARRFAALALTIALASAAFASAAGASPTGGTAPADPTPNTHVSAVESAFATDDDGVVPVIVSLRDDPAVKEANGRAKHFDVTRRRVVGRFAPRSLRALRELSGAPFVSMHVTRAQFDRLRSAPGVADITLDGVSSVSGTTYYGAANGQQLPSMWDIPRIGADWTNANGWTGKSMKVAIIDSGVDSANPYLSGRVVNEACFATNPNGTGACANGGTYQYAATAAGVKGSARWTGCTFEHYSCSHGTHVAQTAAGAYGVARGASIVAIRAGHKEWVAKDNMYKVMFSNSDILNSLWYVYSILPKSNIIVSAVNMSIGGGVYSSTCDNAVPDVTSYINALRNTYQIPTVIAAGNDNSASGVSWPACISTAVVVGNSTLTAASGGVDAWFGGGFGASNSSSLVDMLAPGTDICSAVPTWIVSSGWECGWFGTSMAAPHVAGAMAALTQKRPTATVTQLVTALQISGARGGVAVTDTRNNVTRTRINVANAIYYNNI